MAIIIDKPGLGELLGSSLGGGLSQGLQALANQKLQQMYQQNQQAQLATSLQSALGISPEKASAYATLPESSLAQILKQHQAQQGFGQFQDRLRSNYPFARSQPENNLADGERSVDLDSGNITPEIEALAVNYGPLAVNYVKALKDQQQFGETKRHHRALESLGEKRATSTELQNIVTSNKPFNARLNADVRNYPVVQNRLNRLEQLLGNGDIATGLFSKLSNVLQSEGQQEAQGIINELITLFSQPGSLAGLKGQALIGSLPSLMNTPGGIKRMINSLRAIAQIPKIYADTRNKIIANNGGNEPRNLEQLVYEQAGPRIEKYLGKYSEPDKKTRKQKEGNQPTLPIEKVQEAAQGLGITSPLEVAKQYFNEDSEASKIARDDMRLESDLAYIDKTAKRERLMKAKELAQSMPSYAPQQDFGGEFGAGDPYSHAQDAKYIAGRIAQGTGEGVTGLVGLPFNLASLASGGKIPVPQAIQTIQQLPERAVRAVAGDLQPETETGQRFGEVAGDIASLVSPGGLLSVASKGLRAAKMGSKFIDTAAKILKISPQAALKVAGSGGFAKWGAEKLGATESQANLAKGAAMLAVPLLGGTSGLTNQVNALEQAATAASQGKYVQPGTQMGVLFKTIANAGPELTAEQQAITNALKNIKGTSIPVSDVLKIQQAATSPKVRQAAESLLELATKQHPDFGTVFNEFIDLSNAAETTSAIQSFMKDKAKYVGRNPVMTALLTSLGMTRKNLSPYVLGAGAAAMAAGQAEKIVKLAMTSPAWRKTYGDLIKAALAGEAQLANKAIANMDKVIVHEEKKGKL